MKVAQNAVDDRKQGNGYDLKDFYKACFGS